MTLPVPLTNFVGRTREVTTLGGLLAEWRLVTLTGAAGSGKTRLALAVAERHRAEDVAWVDLAALDDPALLAGHVASRLGVREEAGRPPLDTLQAALGERALLLVLDNCEHLAAACAALARSLLGACPALRILATSREPLAVDGERVWPVPLLPMADAVTLFADRAAAVNPAFTIAPEGADDVAAICLRVDGLPLAIELAAARTTVLTPTQILARLDAGLGAFATGGRTAPDRQRTLRAAIDWSHALLDAPERTLLARLAVFAGSFSLGAVERVCADAALPAGTILDHLAVLVEKSLVMMEVRAGEARYRLLEVVRQYAWERLQDGGEEPVLVERHAECFVALAEESEAQMLGFAAVRWTAILDDELPNLRIAFDRALRDPARADVALRIASHLYGFWRATGQFTEGRARLAVALAARGPEGERERARAETALGFLALCQGERANRRAPLVANVARLRALGDAEALGSALLCLGMTDLLAGQGGLAAAPLAEAATIARAAGKPALLAQVLYWQGSAARAAGDLRGATAALEEAVALTRVPGIEHPHGYCLARLALFRALGGDTAGAIPLVREALEIQHRTRDRWGVLQAIDTLAVVALESGEGTRAARLLGASDGICRQMDASAPLDLAEYHEPALAAARAALGESVFARAHAAGLSLSLDEALDAAMETVRALAPGAPDSADRPPPATERAPALRVRSLGRLEVLRDGAPIPLGDWRAARTRELLLYLLTHPEGRTREQVALTFWPDASPAAVKNNFHNTLHHLRRALRNPELVTFERERYRVRWELGVEFDAAVFERDVRSALRERPVRESAAPLRRALERYGGDFLDDARMGDWHLVTRDRLRRLFLDGLAALGESDEAGGDATAAAETYRRVLAVEPLDEAACRRLMLVLVRMGDRTGALREFERLRARLRAELAAEPEPATTALAARLRGAAAPGPGEPGRPSSPR